MVLLRYNPSQDYIYFDSSWDELLIFFHFLCHDFSRLSICIQLFFFAISLFFSDLSYDPSQDHRSFCQFLLSFPHCHRWCWISSELNSLRLPMVLILIHLFRFDSSFVMVWTITTRKTRNSVGQNWGLASVSTATKFPSVGSKTDTKYAATSPNSVSFWNRRKSISRQL